MYFFTKFIYNEYIGPYFFIACCSTIFAGELPEDHELKPLTKAIFHGLTSWSVV